jgi:hypothetical protein
MTDDDRQLVRDLESDRQNTTSPTNQDALLSRHRSEQEVTPPVNDESEVVWHAVKLRYVERRFCLGVMTRRR